MLKKLVYIAKQFSRQVQNDESTCKTAKRFAWDLVSNMTMQSGSGIICSYYFRMNCDNFYILNTKHSLFLQIACEYRQCYMHIIKYGLITDDLPNMLEFSLSNTAQSDHSLFGSNDLVHEYSLSTYATDSISLPLIHVSCSVLAITIPSHTTLPP